MKKPILGKNSLVLAIMTLITVLVWIALDVYRIATKPTKTNVTEAELAPLTVKIDKETIDQLKNNLSFTQEELNTTFVSTPSLTQTKTEIQAVIPTETSSESAVSSGSAINQ